MRTKGSAAELEARRRLAADLLRDGNTPTEVAQLLGVSFSSIKRWKRAFLRDGLAGLAAKPHPGPRPKLSEDQRDELCDLLVAGALAAGFATDVVLINHLAGVVEHGRAADLLTSEKLSRLYGLPIEVARENQRTLVWMASGADEVRP